MPAALPPLTRSRKALSSAVVCSVSRFDAVRLLGQAEHFAQAVAVGIADRDALGGFRRQGDAGLPLRLALAGLQVLHRVLNAGVGEAGAGAGAAHAHGAADRLGRVAGQEAGQTIVIGRVADLAAEVVVVGAAIAVDHDAALQQAVATERITKGLAQGHVGRLG